MIVHLPIQHITSFQKTQSNHTLEGAGNIACFRWRHPKKQSWTEFLSHSLAVTSTLSGEGGKARFCWWVLRNAEFARAGALGRAGVWPGTGHAASKWTIECFLLLNPLLITSCQEEVETENFCTVKWMFSAHLSGCTCKHFISMWSRQATIRTEYEIPTCSQVEKKRKRQWWSCWWQPSPDSQVHSSPHTSWLIPCSSHSGIFSHHPPGDSFSDSLTGSPNSSVPCLFWFVLSFLVEYILLEMSFLKKVLLLFSH